VGEFVTREWLKTRLEEIRQGGAKVVFTNGCFDLLHRGHVEYLKQARGFGDFLVVGLNSDSSVQRLKGEGRPYVPEEDRAAVLSALACVDYVCIFDEDTPLKLIKEFRPEVLVKGRDYELSEVVGAEEVKGWGGEVRLVDLVPHRSTTEMAKRIARGPSGEGCEE
jgi:D-beta-D-heptose 7-phosphate kinase/D-beta-D-heptose 1-phosphate adenosyltransferase